MKLKQGKYQHYKGNFYEVIDEAIDSDTLEEYVIYRGLYDDPKFGHNPLWIRNKKEFLEKVEIDGKKVDRYKFVDDM